MGGGGGASYHFELWVFRTKGPRRAEMMITISFMDIRAMNNYKDKHSTQITCQVHYTTVSFIYHIFISKQSRI